MAYCTLSDIEKCLDPNVLVYVTDDAGSGVVDEDKVTEAIAKAGAEVESYCRASYTVPFDPVPDLIRSLTCDIAVYNLFARRGFRENTADVAVQERHKNAAALLRDIARGLASVATGTPEEPETYTAPVLRTREKIFDEMLFEGFI